MLTVVMEKFGHTVLHINKCGTDVDPVKVAADLVEKIS